MKKLFILILFCILIIGFANTTSANERWQYFCSDDKFELFFDTKSMQKNETTTYVVWVKWKNTDVYSKEEAKELKFKNPISHSLVKYEYDYSNNNYRVLSIIYYDKTGKVLASTYTSSDWKSNPPNSVREVIFNETYKYYKENNK